MINKLNNLIKSNKDKADPIPTVHIAEQYLIKLLYGASLFLMFFFCKW